MLSRLWSDRRGNVAAIFSLMAIPTLFMAGSGYDYARASRLRTQVQAAVDGIALTLCKTPLSTTSSDLETQAKNLLAAYVPSGATLVTPLPITMNPRQITVTATSSSPTMFAGLMGFSKMDVAATARCATPMPQTFEIALVLDTTGSMDTSDGTNSKMTTAKKAAKDFIDLIGDSDKFDDQTRISVVPFATTVSVDTTTLKTRETWIDYDAKSAYHWTNIDVPNASTTIKNLFTSRFAIFDHLKGYVGTWKWQGCFETQPYPANTRVDAPTASVPNNLFVPYFAPDEPGGATTGIAVIRKDADNTKNKGQNDPPTDEIYTNLSPETQIYGNSYLVDRTSEKDCATGKMNAGSAEKRACKYYKPAGYKASGSNGPNMGCNQKPLKRLTTAFSSLKTYIDTFVADGNTNIFEGFMWGWRTVAPQSGFADASPASRKDVGRVIVLMTDGANTWTTADGYNINDSVYTSMAYLENADGSRADGTGSTGRAGRLKTGRSNPLNGDASRAALDELTLEGCTNAKAAGINIYTVGFSVPNDKIDDQGLDLLKKCASSESQYYLADSSNKLLIAFKDIARSIGQLRLTQ